MFTDKIFSEKVAVITGGGTGLGKETAKQLAVLGAKIALLSRNEDHLRQGENDIREITPEVISKKCDVREANQIKDARAVIMKTFGRIDILINNAAGNFIYPAEKLPLRGWKAVVDIVLNGSFYCSQIFGQQMIRQNQGNIINILATYAWTGGPGTIHSACAKAGVLAMTRTLAVEWARYGIRVNAVAPGPVDTPGARERLWPTDEIARKIKEEIPLKRFAAPAEVVDAITFLLSPYAAYINGECLTIDGGAWLGKGIGKALDFIDRFAELREAGKKKNT
jgi:NAD(P)-dependent dehydrogenase (short-subunit alcohol dehydrogenase family)